MDYELDTVTTMDGLRKALIGRRKASGFDNAAKLVDSRRNPGGLPKSTAYKLESGPGECTWPSVQSYLRACGADDAEIATWREPFDRALAHFENSDPPNIACVLAPTAKQLEEMGAEQAARLLGQIELPEATDLLRRIDRKRAVELLPEINPKIAVALLADMTSSRRALLFENIELDRGGELLADMTLENAKELLDELDAHRAAELIAAMPRVGAARVLNISPSDRAIRLLTEMPASKAAKLLDELDFELVLDLFRNGRQAKADKIFEGIDQDLATHILAEHMTESETLSMLTRVGSYRAAACLGRMPDQAAHGLVKQMPISRIAEMFSSLNYSLQDSLLSKLLDVEQAAIVIQKSDFDDGFLFHMLSNLEAERLAQIVRSIDLHEQGLMLTAMPAIRDLVLKELPAEDADLLRQRLYPETLASDLAEIEPLRAAIYLTELDKLGSELLSTMPAAAAARIVASIGMFDEMAECLKSVNPERVAEIIMTMNTSEGAATLSEMPTERVALTLAQLSQTNAEWIFEALTERIDIDRKYNTELSSNDLKDVRVKRIKEVALLRAQVEKLRKSRPEN
jgi:Mg/Co/Ni transporter MgtE